ncbi:hypothetical protein AMATHDRAFT_143183 [Amanita thiersii Skay4041]|uniref:Nudix hydrolase domain-containing protein n=1 Tax=Amanita thiersii Skay4041 TaxID=703135 RepID=A0A2A9NU04_9AGAR|nr:hypothetical protein AMATHDRAFT_143183 [Amanita thiersii Skay4041]
MSIPLSYLDIVNICDNARIKSPSPIPSVFDSEKLIPLRLSQKDDSPAIGLLRPVIVEQLQLENKRSKEIGQQELWSINEQRVSFSPWCDSHDKRTRAMKELCERWRDAGLFEDVCGPRKWRNELYPVYADPLGVHDHPLTSADGAKMNYALEMERSACALFGIVTYGVHMSVYQETEAEGVKSLTVWVPSRSKTKPTWPGRLDNTVAGGIPSGMTAIESLIKESMEEASIEEDIVRKYARPNGAVSYFFRTATGWLQPEVEYVYDLAIPLGADPLKFEPKPLDDEVEDFKLLNHNEIISKMRAGLFKPNCAIVILDLLIRLGYVTPENEPDYMHIVTRLHGRFDYDKW